MSQQTGGYAGSTASGSAYGQQPTTQVARDEAAEVGRTAADAGRQVAGTAAEQAANVAQEVKAQARDLVGEARGQVQGQARAGQQKAADGIRALSQELRQMAEGGGQSGTVSEVARQVADRADSLAGWLGDREPGDLLEEVRSFARRRPGAFLLGAAIAGVVVGRLTRGAVDAARSESGPAPQGAYGSRYAEPGYTAARSYPPDYGTPGYTAHTAPGYAGGYAGSGYGEPGYAQAGYTEPRYTEPRYTEPRYTEPRYDQPGYTGTAATGHVAPSPVPSSAPTPPQGIPAASTLPPAPADVDPLDRPRTVGEYVDEVERGGEHSYADERRGDGGLR